MRRNLSWFAFVLLLTAAFAIAQTTGQSSSAQQSTSGQSSAQSTPNQPEGANPATQSPAQPNAQGTASTTSASGNDDQLTQQIKDQLASNPDFSNVSVTVVSGRATLSGSVPNKDDRNKARDMAKSVPGVKSVREHLTVSGAGGSAANGTMTNSANPPAGGKSFVQSSGSAPGSTTNPNAGAGTQTGATAQSATGQGSQSSSSSSSTQPPASSTASPGTTPSTMPQSGEAPSTSSSTSTTSLEQAKGQIQSALQQQLPSAASGVTVAIDQTSGNQITLNGAVSTEQDKQRAEDVARSAAPGATIVNNLKVGSAGEKPPSESSSSLPPSGVAASGSASSLPPTSSSATSSTTQPPSDVTSQPSTGQSSTMPQSGEASANSQSSNPSGSSSATGSTSSSQGSTGAQSSTSGQSMSQPATSSQSGLPQGEETADTATLQGQIQQALQNETTLSNDKVGVNVTDTEIELTGNVATNKDKQTAKRIAQSYAGNRKVVDHLKITGKSKGSSDSTGSPQPPL